LEAIAWRLSFSIFNHWKNGYIGTTGEQRIPLLTEHAEIEPLPIFSSLFFHLHPPPNNHTFEGVIIGRLDHV
jgi:hypothetical protein